MKEYGEEKSARARLARLIFWVFVGAACFGTAAFVAYRLFFVI